MFFTEVMRKLQFHISKQVQSFIKPESVRHFEE